MRSFALLLLIAATGLVGCGSEASVREETPELFSSEPVEVREEEEFEVHEGPCSRDGTELIDLINEFRVENDLPPVPLSVSLCKVAEVHLADILDYEPINDGDNCALQSWSDNTDASGCCYSSDHSNAECMWEKPSELTEYPGFGYESVALNTMDVAQTMDQLRMIQGHTDLILERGAFSNVDWRALGADYRNGSATIWFGEEDDPVQAQ